MVRLLWVLAVSICGWQMAWAQDHLESMVEQSVHSLRTHYDGTWLKEFLHANTPHSDHGKSRQKRLVLLPKKSKFEMKWNIDFPFETYTRFNTALQFALVLDIFYGAEFLMDQDKPTLAELLGDKHKEFIHSKYYGDDYSHHGYDDHHSGGKGGKGGSHKFLHRKKREIGSTQRSRIYSVIETLIARSGVPGRECMLRTICDVAEAPFEEDLLGKIINTVFRPSREAPPTLEAPYSHYLEAETHGRHNGSCAVRYPECPGSIFTQLPFVEHNFIRK